MLTAVGLQMAYRMRGRDLVATRISLMFLLVFCDTEVFRSVTPSALSEQGTWPHSSPIILLKRRDQIGCSRGGGDGDLLLLLLGRF